MQSEFEPKIPAHESRHDFALVGADCQHGRLAVAARIDRGRMKGKKIVHTFDPAEREQLLGFTEAASVPPRKRHTKAAYVGYLNDEGASIRFSARVQKAVEVWAEEFGRWVRTESTPTEDPAKYRFLYSLTGFAGPQGESQLHLDKSFFERRKQLQTNNLS